MSYKKKQTKILDPKTAYNKIYKQYDKHHDFLQNFDKNLRQRFVPAKLDGACIVDLWCWDGRISNFFLNKWIEKYIWLDISENMLSKTKSYVTKIPCDLNEKFPLDDESADLMICLFTVLHINNLDSFFAEISRVLKQDWTCIIFHHIERKSYIYEHKQDTFKIANNKRAFQEIEKLLEYNFLKYNIYDIKESEIVIWKYFICKK